MRSLILLSLGFTTLVAFLMAIGFVFIAPNIALAVFFITFALEWVIMEPVNRMLRLKSVKAEAVTIAKLTRLEEAVAKQSVALECEYCNELNAVKVDLNGSNAFVCSKCENGNKVITQFSTARSANPLETMGATDTPAIIDELGETDEKIEAEIEAEING